MSGCNGQNKRLWHCIMTPDCMGITLGKKLGQAVVNKINEGSLYLPLSISGYYTTTVLGLLFLSASLMTKWRNKCKSSLPHETNHDHQPSVEFAVQLSSIYHQQIRADSTELQIRSGKDTHGHQEQLSSSSTYYVHTRSRSPSPSAV
eukprot:scaffold3809_cov91-Skeletonema_dohrnii-CCMP3373.AAC.3